MTTRSLSLVAVTMVALAATFFAYTDASAQLGDGVCSPAEAQNLQCASFGTVGTLEIIRSNGQFPTFETCKRVVTLEPVPCTVWRYEFLPQGGTNQLNILIPASLETLTPPGFPDGSRGNCSQFYTNGGGDPTTGFGKNVLTHDTCRIAPTAGSVVPNVVIATSVAPAGPMAAHLKSGSKTFGGQLLGPLSAGPPIPQVATTNETVTNLQGNSLTVEISPTGEVVSATASTGLAVIIPDGGAVLCSTDDADAIAAFPGAPFPGSPWTCDQIVFNDGNNIQAGSNTTCYYRNKATGRLVAYNC